MNEEIKAWRDKFPEMEYSEVTNTIVQKGKFKCYISEDDTYDYCVMEINKPYLCDVAKKLQQEGKTKFDCPNWRL